LRIVATVMILVALFQSYLEHKNARWHVHEQEFTCKTQQKGSKKGGNMFW
jgi:hypothetical protein